MVLPDGLLWCLCALSFFSFFLSLFPERTLGAVGIEGALSLAIAANEAHVRLPGCNLPGLDRKMSATTGCWAEILTKSSKT